MHGERTSVAGARWVLVLLVGVSALNVADRHVFGLLIVPIQADLGLSDTIMGLLAGFAFAAFHLVAGIPVARWADVGNRRTIIAAGLLVWSFMTALCGLAQTGVQLALARIGVGVGEAAGAPPGHSLLSDYFPVERRGTALGSTSMGGSLGLVLALPVGGMIAERFGWRAVCLAAGVPGILLAIVFRTRSRVQILMRGKSRCARAGSRLYGRVESTMNCRRFGKE